MHQDPSTLAQGAQCNQMGRLQLLITAITRKFTAALCTCAANSRSESSVFINRTVPDSQIISILSSHNSLESFMKHLYIIPCLMSEHKLNWFSKRTRGK